MMYNDVLHIACDHAGFELKNELITYLEANGFQVKDHGCYSEESIDYPDYGHKVAELVSKSDGLMGILLCGSGNGINMTANKHQHVRSALCWNVEIAQLARQHNNANILTIPARFVSSDEAKKMVDVFFKTEFEGGRHLTRINKIPVG